MTDTERPATTQSQSLARLAHREQVWAAMVRAVVVLLEETETGLLDQLEFANRNGDEEHVAVLTRRMTVLTELRREISSPLPGAPT